jgi:hypothetical protein
MAFATAIQRWPTGLRFRGVFETPQVPLFQRASYYLARGPTPWPTDIPFDHLVHLVGCGKPIRRSRSAKRGSERIPAQNGSTARKAMPAERSS